MILPPPLQNQPAYSMHAQIEAYLHELQHLRARSLNTLLAYRADLVQFSRYIHEGAIAAGRMQPGFGDGDLPAWEQLLRAHGYAPATVARKLAVAGAFATWLRSQGLTAPSRTPSATQTETGAGTGQGTGQGTGADAGPDAPLDGAQLQPAQDTRISPAEIALLLERAQGDGSAQGVRDAAMLQMICALGVRVGELAALDVHAHFAHERRIAIGAGARRRVLALPAAVADALQLYVANGRLHLQVDPEEVALFLNHRGRRLTRQGIWLIVARHAQSAGLGDTVTPQALRRAYLQGEILRGVDAQNYAAQSGTSAGRRARAWRNAVAQAPSSPTLIIDGKPYLDGTHAVARKASDPTSARKKTRKT